MYLKFRSFVGVLIIVCVAEKPCKSQSLGTVCLRDPVCLSHKVFTARKVDLWNDLDEITVSLNVIKTFKTRNWQSVA